MFNRVKRFLGTSIGFILFGIFGLLFSLLLIPLSFLSKNHLAIQFFARRLNSRIWYFFIKYLVASGVLSFKFKGKESLGEPGQLILCNHPSLLDVLFIISNVPTANCIVKNDLKKNPVMIGPILACGYLPNNDPLELIDAAHHTLQNQCLLIFPEGTRTGWDGIIKFNRGAISIGLRSAKKITPIIIKMCPPNFKKGQAWYKIPKNKIHYEITVMDDIVPQDYLQNIPLHIAARHLNKKLEDLFQRNS